MNFFDHKDLGNHLLQLCPKVVNTLYIRSDFNKRQLQQANGPKNRNLFLLRHIPTEFGHHSGVVFECEDEITYVLHQTESFYL